MRRTAQLLGHAGRRLWSQLGALPGRLNAQLRSRRGRASAFVLTGLSALALVAGALRITRGAAGVPAELLPPGDTVAIWGPLQFNGSEGQGQTYVEQFTTTVTPGRLYTLHLVNGAQDGTHRASKVTVNLNGFEIVSQTEVTQAVGQLDRVVAVTDVDTILVVVAGSGDPYIALSVLSIATSEFDVYGPNQYNIPSGTSATYDESFPKATTAVTPYRVYVVNGASNGTQRVTSASVTLNGSTIVSTSELTNAIGSLAKDVTLLSSNSLQVVANGAVNSYIRLRFTATDTTPPGLTITAPAPNAITNQNSIAVTGTISDQTPTAVTVNGASATVTNNTSYSATVSLGSEGSTLLTVRATDAGGRSTDSTRTIIRDTQAPTLGLTSPADGAATRQTTITVAGTANDANGLTVNTNGTPFTVGGDGSFSGPVALVAGVNVLTTTATDGAGNATSVIRTVTQDAVAPVLTVSSPADGATSTGDGILVSGTVSDATPVTVAANGISLPVNAGAFSKNVPLSFGPNAIAVVATDAATNATTVTRNVTRAPPDPLTVAPPLDPTVASTMIAATSFLYSGANPIQTGVAPGTITPTRIAVLRGKLMTRDGQPIVGASVTVLGRPEFGSTYSRLDGAYDLAVNGGQQLILSFAKTGFLPAQRSVTPAQQDYAPVGDVALIPNDTLVTAITLPGSTVQVAQGSVTSDTSGSRRATVLFKPGTTATMTLPDGSTQPLSALNVRATEYTVGSNGPAAMPGALPRNSGYTYAVELTVDQAQTAGATDVQFSQPVPTYVENFLGFPVGMAVPSGYYDPKKAQWVPSANGLVMKKLGVSGGMADLDITGDGVADDSAALAGIGIDRPERERLATLYAAGTTVWRVPVTHFSPRDLNWPAFLQAIIAALKEFWKSLHPCPGTKFGSVIYCESQALGEDIAVAGTPFTLHYQSDRTAANGDARTLRIRLTGQWGYPPGTKRIDREVYVAGRTFKTSYQPAANLVTTFIWDGLDAYGRTVHGTQLVRVRIGYASDAPYQVPAQSPSAFARFGGTSTSVTARQEIVSWQEGTTTIGGWDAAGFGLGGWSLSDLHAYDPVSRTLIQGDGQRREALDQSRIITTVVGTGVSGFSGDGGPATAAKIYSVTGLAFGPDGSLYFSDGNNYRIRRVSPDGIITTVAGNGGSGFSGDGGPALQAQIGRPERLHVARDGSILFGVFNGARIRKVDPAGIITTVAGTGTAGWSGDGGPATAANISQYPRAVSFDPDGGFYSLDDYNRRAVRRVSTDGIIWTIAGTGFATYNGDGILAVNAALCNPEDLALGPEGSVYVEDGCNGRVRRIRPHGFIETVLGTGVGGFSGDGGPATQAQITSGGIDVGPDGTLYLADRSNNRIRRVGPDGIVTTIAGGPGTATSDSRGDNGPATLAKISSPQDVAVAPDGSIYVVGNIDKIRRLSPPLPGFAATDIAIASDEGSQLYQFDQYGRHLRTRDALTGAALLSFGYDGAGRVVSITDAVGNVTTVERNAQGQPTAIVGPFGQRTTLTVDGAGYLASVLDPAANRVRLFHQPTGLLDSLTDTRGSVHRFTYDSLGRLRRDDGVAGFYQTLALTETDTGGTVAVASALGRTTTNEFEAWSNGNTLRVATDASGFASRSVIDPAGRTTIALPSGDSVWTVSRPDPRWIMQAPNLDTLIVRVPSGATIAVNARRSVTLANPNDPLSITGQYDTSWVGGQRYARTAIKSGNTWLVTSTTPVNRQSFVRLDSLDRPVMTRVTGLDSVTLHYDGQGRPDRVQNGGRIEMHTYDAQSRLKTTTDPLGRTDSLFYDTADLLTRTRLWDGRQVQFGYDSSGNLTSLTPPGRPAHAFTYRSDDRVQNYMPPSLGSGTWATSYGYNLDGQLTSVARPTGDSVLFSYNPTNGRPTGVSFSRGLLGTGSLTYGYSTTTGALTSITHSAGSSLAFAYDGMLPLSVTWSGPVAGTVAVGYDAAFRVDTIQVNGSPIALGYDNDGLLKTAGALKLGRRTDNGLLQADTLGVVTGSWTFDGRAALASYTAKVSGSNVYQANYIRDSVGRVSTATETVQGTTLTRGFTYDSAGRVSTVTENSVLVRTYGYDQNGNRTSLVGPGLSLTGSYDAQDRVLSYGTTTYSHDRDGFLSEKVVGTDTTRYAYDALDNLLQVSLPGGPTIEYVIDAQNRRVAKKVNGVLQTGWLWQSQLAPAAELDGTGAVVSRFVYGTRPNVPDYLVKGGVNYRLVLDQLGSVRLVVNTTDGTVAQRIDYDEFGRVTQNTNPAFQPFGYAGGLYDEQTGLVRFGARDYDPITGQWTAKEPQGFTGGDPNLYAYAGSDPVSFADPTGKIPVPGGVWGLVGCAAGGALESMVLQAAFNGCVDYGQVGKDALIGAAGCALAGALGRIGRFLDELGEAGFARLQRTVLGDIKWRFLHPETSLSPANLEGIRRMSTDAIVQSLEPGAREALRVNATDVIVNGNHRLRVLIERGYDILKLPFERF